MKRILLIAFALLLSFNVKAQTTLTEAVDFHSIDDYGRDVHLFDILDDGQYALLYFFFSDAESSPVFDPCIAEAYYYYGANQDNVYFIGVAPSDDSLSIDYWREEYQVDFPVIHWFTDGSTAQDICEDYGVKIFSTLVLIAPDRQIVIDNIWPINSTQQLIDEINAVLEIEIEDDETDDDTTGLAELKNNEIKIYPNPATSEISIVSLMNGEADVRIYDMSGRCVKETRVNDMSKATINISDIKKGIYFIDVNGKVEKLVVE